MSTASPRPLLSPEDRHIPHTMPDYREFISQLQLNSSQLSLPGSTSTPEHTPTFKSSSTYHRLQQETRSWIAQSVELMVKHFPPESRSAPTSLQGRFREESSIYVGCGGNAYLHWKLARFFEREHDPHKADCHREGAVKAVEAALSLVPNKFAEGDRIAFYFGSAGVHALSAVIYWMCGYLSKTEDQFVKLLSFLPSCLSSASPDEILCGRAGYLFCLQFVQKHVSKELCERMQLQNAARQVFDAIIASGKKNSHPGTGVLTYHFRNKDYHGAAHGTSGILYMLLQFPSWCREPPHLPWIVATLENILSSQFPSGNFPSKHSADTDKLVHWCHGAPGVVYTLYHAHKVLGDDKTILRSLDLALGTIWERGVLRKGLGVCHGTSGSAYAFLMMYRYTGGEEHLYRAYKMAEAMRSEEVVKACEAFCDPQRYEKGMPDFPYSLMEGLGGAVCFCCDLLHPDTAAFPGYEGDI